MKWFKYVIGGVIIVVGVIIFQLIPRCAADQIIPIEDLTDSIQAQKILKDSVHKEVIYKDSIRIVYVTKWRTLKGHIDTIPCEQALPLVIHLTDSIIQVDSSEIASLKAEIFIDSLIIGNQDKRHSQDSVKIRKLKRQRNVIAGVGALGWILAIVK